MMSDFRRFLTRESSSQLESDKTDLENQDTLLHSTSEASDSLPTHSDIMLNSDNAETLRNRRELAYMAAARRIGQTDTT